jgi:hypothetical protein
VFESGGHTYLIPESTAARRVDLYRFERFPRGLARVATLVEGVGLVDSTPVCVDGQWYLFSTTSQPFMETVLFTAPRLEGPWRLHPASPLSSSVRSSRSAGHLFRYGGRLYRPTQDCSVHYGYAMTVNEVLSITPTEYAERPATWIGPSWAPRIVGTHTLNTSTRWQVVDGIRKVPVHG